MSCVVEKDCKEAGAVLPRAFDLSWYCSRKWRSGAYFAADTRIRVAPIEAGGTQPTTGWQYKALNAGWTGEQEPTWPTTSGGTVTDGSIVWEREAVSTASLERTISDANDVTWSGDTGMTVTLPALDTAGGQVLISALHGGGTAGRKLSTWADVTFSDTTEDRFEIQWKIT